MIMPERARRDEVESGFAPLSGLGATRIIKPDYLTSADLPWLQALVAERQRFVGQPRRMFRAQIANAVGLKVPVAKLKMALRVIDRVGPARSAVVSWPSARKVREAAFREAVRRQDRAEALAAVAARLGIAVDDVFVAMFADLPEERRLAPWPEQVDACQLLLRCNEALIGELLQRAVRVRIRARGHVRAVVRQAHVSGLLCVVLGGSTECAAEIEVSGPLALFRHSRLYGRALAGLVPRLARCNSFRLEADCVIHRSRELGRLVIRSGDPIDPARALPEFDSRVEECFARDFSELALEWDVIREPQPIAARGGLFFPDFELRRRTTGDRYWLEIVGFWTPEYLKKKLEQLTQARLERAILCVDASREQVPEQLEALGHVVRYKRTVDVRAVLSIVDPVLASRIREMRVKRRRRA